MTKKQVKSEIKEVVFTSEIVGDNEHVFMTDPDTGELIKDYWRLTRDNLPKKAPPKGKNPHFKKLYATNLQDIVRKKKLAPYEAGVFFMCIAFVGWESNFLVHPDTNKNLTCGDLSQLTGINQEQLRRTLESLNGKGMISIVKNGKGTASQYMLNSNVVFWGQKMKDISEHDVFRDCAYEAPVKIQYMEREKQ